MASMRSRCAEKNSTVGSIRSCPLVATPCPTVRSHDTTRHLTGQVPAGRASCDPCTAGNQPYKILCAFALTVERRLVRSLADLLECIFGVPANGFVVIL